MQSGKTEITFHSDQRGVYKVSADGHNDDTLTCVAVSTAFGMAEALFNQGTGPYWESANSAEGLKTLTTYTDEGRKVLAALREVLCAIESLEPTRGKIEIFFETSGGDSVHDVKPAK